MFMSTPWQRQLDEAIDSQVARMIEVRRHLHRYPEPSGEEYETTRYLRGVLAEAGLDARVAPSGRGLMVEASAAEVSPAPRIALRADMDALHIHDAKNVEYSSCRPGVMHACGHDAHTAAVLGAILGLKSAAEALPHPVRWRGIFQPAEEMGDGALEMIAAGAVEGVEAILALHMDPTRPTGRIGLRYGVLTAACDELEICITGRGGHAARPHESLDPIAAAAQLISSIYLFIPRATESSDAVVVTIGEVKAGDNPNVIPERALLRGTIRTLAAATRERTKTHIRQLVKGLAEVSGTSIEVTFQVGPQSVVNDTSLTDVLHVAGSELLGEEHLDIIGQPSMGGEDFAEYLDHVPGAMFRLGCARSQAGDAPLHTPDFDIDERSLAIGAKILARAAVLWSAPQRSTVTSRRFL